MIYWGLWQSEQQVDSSLERLEKASEKIKALEAQLTFRQKVLQQKPTDLSLKDVYAFTMKSPTERRRIALDSNQLADNLNKLIRHSFTLEGSQTSEGADQSDQAPLLVGKLVNHKFVSGEESKWFRGKVISQV